MEQSTRIYKKTTGLSTFKHNLKWKARIYRIIISLYLYSLLIYFFIYSFIYLFIYLLIHFLSHLFSLLFLTFLLPIYHFLSSLSRNLVDTVYYESISLSHYVPNLLLLMLQYHCLFNIYIFILHIN